MFLPKGAGVPRLVQGTHHDLVAEWNAFFPKELTAQGDSDLLEYINLQVADLDNEMLMYTEFDGVAYVASTLVLFHNVTEVLASDYMRAEGVRVAHMQTSGATKPVHGGYPGAAKLFLPEEGAANETQS
jgi:hypothetical protein